MPGVNTESRESASHFTKNSASSRNMARIVSRVMDVTSHLLTPHLSTHSHPRLTGIQSQSQSQSSRVFASCLGLLEPRNKSTTTRTTPKTEKAAQAPRKRPRPRDQPQRKRQQSARQSQKLKAHLRISLRNLLPRSVKLPKRKRRTPCPLQSALP
jgi:hypothetical protein